MCGIVGFCSAASRVDALYAMLDTLSHRGPDASGSFVEHDVHLGHTRLSIIDLSTAANQPMHSSDNQLVIVFNGEIYNFQELATRFSLSLSTRSDTEVILALYRLLGAECLQHFNGMFAFAIYNRTTGELFLARDRMGVKPLFYYRDSSHFVFASELKAILAFPFVQKELCYEAIAYYLHLGYIPEPYTAYKNIFKFPSGHYATWKNSSLTIQPYWVIETKFTKELIEDEKVAERQLHELLHSSIQQRLIADVPYGTFLSGGTDSSLVTAIAAQHVKHINTFTIGFKEADYNEAPYAKAIARHLQTEHHEYILSYSDAIELIPSILSTYDEPYADSSAIPSMLISRCTRQEVKMVLTGDGGDELFMGYGAYRWAKRLNNPLLFSFRKLLHFLLSYGNNRMQRASQLFNVDTKEHLLSHIFSQEQYLFSEEELSEYLLFPVPKLHFSVDTSRIPRSLLPEEVQALFDMKYYLKDDLLVKIDRASMRYGLEAREPLLDYRIVELALNIAPSLKIKQGSSKYLLKKILYQYIPQKYFDRPKWGFAVPLRHWLKKELKFLIEEALQEKEIKRYGLLRYESVNQLVTQYLSGKDYLYNRVWTLIVLQEFLKKHFSN